MVKTLSSKISDPRPRINISLASDDDKTLVQVTNSFVNVQRGPKTAILRVPVGELAGALEVLIAANTALQEHGYDTTAGSEEPLAAPTTRAKHTSPVEPEQAAPAEATAETNAPADNPFATASA